MPHPDTLNPAIVGPTPVAGGPERVVRLGPFPAIPTPFRPRRYSQNIQILVGLLRCYGKLAPEAADMILQDMTARLVAEVKMDHFAHELNEVQQ